MGEYDDRTRPVGSSDPVPSMMPQEAKTEVQVSLPRFLKNANYLLTVTPLQEAQNPVAFGETGLTTEMLDFSIQATRLSLYFHSQTHIWVVVMVAPLVDSVRYGQG